MIKGIGIDLVKISDIEHLLNISDSFLNYTFTPAEQQAGSERSNKAEYFAGRFAAKEAVFKAVAPLLSKNTFDLRITETLTREDGSPYINLKGSSGQPLADVLKQAGIGNIHISITNECEYTAAFVVAESE